MSEEIFPPTGEESAKTVPTEATPEGEETNVETVEN